MKKSKVPLSEKIKRPPDFLTMEKYLRPVDKPIKWNSQSRYPRIVPLVVADYGSVNARIRQMRYVGRNMLRSVNEMAKGVKSIRSNPYAGKLKIGADALSEMEAYARTLGVTDIGYTEVDRRHIFRGFQVLFKYAIVITMEMDRDKMKHAPAMQSFIEIFRTYHALGVVVNRISDFLRARGYNAYAGPAIGGDVNYVPLARDAGLGEIGKNGILVTKNNGPRVRLAAVYTDIENLPTVTENAHGWIRDYCEQCNVCISTCPAHAIYEHPIEVPEGGPAFLDHTKCAKPFSDDNGCSLCIKFCPFSFGDYEKLKTAFFRGNQNLENSTC